MPACSIIPLPPPLPDLAVPYLPASCRARNVTCWSSSWRTRSSSRCASGWVCHPSSASWRPASCWARTASASCLTSRQSRYGPRCYHGCIVLYCSPRLRHPQAERGTERVTAAPCTDTTQVGSGTVVYCFMFVFFFFVSSLVFAYCSWCSGGRRLHRVDACLPATSSSTIEIKRYV